MSSVIGVRGLERHGIAHRTGGDPFAEGSATPWAAGGAPAAERDVVAALVVLGAQDAVGPGAPPAIEVGPDGIQVRWSDGVVDVVPTGEVGA
jgi:hypothetical protein